MVTTEEKTTFAFFICEHWNALLTVAFLFLSAMGFTLWKIRRVCKTQKQLVSQNEDLVAMKEEYTKVITGLIEENRRLSEDKWKRNEYIFRIGKVCADSINHFEEYQKTVRRLYMKGLKEDLTEHLISHAELDRQIENLYSTFDSAVLDMIPDFVEKFNSLLKEGERYKLRDEKTLNPEMRIFALRSLGIRDYSQIAEFLRYKEHTVLNYRSIVKARAISGNEIERQIMSI